MVIVGGPLRGGLGALLLAMAAGTVLVTHDLEFGIGWTAVVPACILGLPGAALLSRRTVARVADRIEIVDGWCWRRAWSLPAAHARLELLPTAGLWAVILHSSAGSRPLGTWIRHTTATRLAAEVGLPLETAPGPAADR
jgi:hypothetical protein